MKNFDRKVWGVPGKQKEYYLPGKFQAEKRIVPLNNNPLEAWDTARSRYRRVDLIPKPVPENIQQMDGINEFESSTPIPDVSATPTPSVTATLTPTTTSTMTPSVTPSSTPYILPETPALWYDATNLASIDYISSGGTDYVQTWRSIGTYQKTLSAATINNAPIWSGSSRMPGQPLIVRFLSSSVSGTTKYLSQRFDATSIPQSGGTYFIVMASPIGATYATTTASTFGVLTRLLSGNTSTGGFDAGVQQNTMQASFGANNAGQFSTIKQGTTTTASFAYSATNIGDKYLVATTLPFPTGFMEMEINQSGFTNTTLFTGSTANTFNQINFGANFTSGGTFGTAAANNGELGEFMFFNRVLSPSEIEAVQNYLRDKWRYNDWASPVPTATPTDTPAATPTPSPTTTNTPTPSITPSQPVFSPSSISNLVTWYDANDASTITKRTGTDFIEVWRDKSGNNYHLTQSTASAQPLFTGGTSVSSWSANTYVYFDGGDYVSRTTGTSFSDSGFTYFYVARIPNTETDGLIFNYTDQAPPVNVGKYRAYMGSASPTYTNQLLLGADNNRMNWSWNSPATIGGKNTYQYGFVSGTTAGAFSGSVNDIIYDASGSAGTIPDTVAAISLGANNDGGAPMVGYIAEVIVYGKVLSTTEKNNVETYLKNKWGYNTW